MRYVVEVNECKVFATGSGTNWWEMYRHRMEFRMTDVQVSLGGNLVHVACETAEDAAECAEMLVERGLPASAIRTRKIKDSEVAA
jgi:hypothetical protein